jgi:hypothetical protein
MYRTLMHLAFTLMFTSIPVFIIYVATVTDLNNIPRVLVKKEKSNAEHELKERK